MSKRSLVGLTLLGIVLVVIGFGAGMYFTYHFNDIPVTSPISFTEKPKPDLPLLAYSFPQLRTRSYQSSEITIESKLAESPEFTSYVFSYNTLGKKMTGQLNIPASVTSDTPVIVMIRGYVPLEIFSTGVGTKNAAAVFARNGFITIAPDFFGYGGSDPEPADSWQARFEKPITVIELIHSVRQKGIPLTTNDAQVHTPIQLGIWGHSNGGQIAMSTLVTLQEAIPTSLWAPVLVPFPYSIMYFSDESEDEGKGMRIWVSQLEADYELRAFSFTQFLDGLRGPLQVQHGTNDEAAPHIWSDEFMVKLKNENVRRAAVLADLEKREATQAGTLTPSVEAQLQPVQFSYTTYPGADHNLQPNQNWNQAVQKDLEFFQKELSF